MARPHICFIQAQALPWRKGLYGGGRANVLYVAASIEQLPSELGGSGELITINFPWAGLRESLLRGEQVVATALQRLSAGSARFQLLINVEESIPDLPRVSPDVLRDSLAVPLAAAAFEIDAADWLPESARVRSRWGGRQASATDLDASNDY